MSEPPLAVPSFDDPSSALPDGLARTMLARIASPIVRIAADGRWLSVNDAFCELIGRSRESLSGSTFESLCHPEDRDRVGGSFARFLARDGEWQVETRVHGCDVGMVRWIRLHATVVERDGRGAPTAVVGVVEDLTERRRGESRARARTLENARLRESVRRSDERNDLYLATLSHELRNPVGAIRNGLGLLRPVCASDGDRWAFGMIDRQMHNLVRLLDDLLDASRITRGELRIRRVPVHPGAIIERVLVDLGPRARRKRLVMDYRADPALGRAMVLADGSRLEQSIAALVSNAIRFTAEGGRIEIGTTRRDGRLVLVVADEGIGIGADQLARVFDPFTQFAREHEHGDGALGLGLTLARELLRLHGGDIEVRSAGQGEGSAFTVTLPLVPGGPEPASEPAPGHGAPLVQRCPVSLAGLETRGARHARGGLDILLVDDHLDALAALRGLLDRAGHRVRGAVDGAGGIAAVADRAPDLLLLDIGLPDISGLEVARCIRANGANGDVYLAALTGFGQDEDRRRSRDAGFDEHLVKPVKLAALLQLIDRVRSCRARSGVTG